MSDSPITILQDPLDCNIIPFVLPESAERGAKNIPIDKLGNPNDPNSIPPGAYKFVAQLITREDGRIGAIGGLVISELNLHSGISMMEDTKLSMVYRHEDLAHAVGINGVACYGGIVFILGIGEIEIGEHPIQAGSVGVGVTMTVDQFKDAFLRSLEVSRAHGVIAVSLKLLNEVIHPGKGKS